MEAFSASLCRGCRQRLQTTHPSRGFSTTGRHNIIPPESPSFIHVPQSLQQDFSRPAPKKGFVPTPRNVFPPKQRSTPEYITRLIERSVRDKAALRPDSELSEQQLYKKRMTDLRKSHHTEGLQELYSRQQKQDNDRADKSDTLRAERARLISQAEREDARLTNNSVPAAMNPDTAPPFSPSEALEMHERKISNVERHQRNKEQHQHNALHSLYMNARNFITDEKQLLAKIEEEFDRKDFGGYTSDNAKSYWDSHGVPDGVARMVDRSTVGRGKMGLSEKEESYRRDQERMKRLAEGLSGGKM